MKVKSDVPYKTVSNLYENSYMQNFENLKHLKHKSHDQNSHQW